MNTAFNKILSAILLVLIGVTIGVLYMQSNSVQHAKVKQTHVMLADSSAVFTVDPSKAYFKNVADEGRESVVFIETSINLKDAMPKDGNHSFGDGFWDRVYPRRTTAAGSGVVLSEDGYILTNNHVVEDAIDDGILVHLKDRSWHKAQVIGVDPSSDLAVIKIDYDKLKPVLIGDSDNVRIGDWVIAIGNPFRLRSTVTAGIVSATGRAMDIINDRMRVENFIQTDAAINSGNSGGALLNMNGELIGVNTAIATRSGSYQGYGFAIPSNLALKVATDIIETGRVDRAIMGVSITDLSFQRARELGLEKVSGIEVREVVIGGAADEAGIRSGDIILDIDGKVVEEVNHLQAAIAMHHPGDLVKVGLWRNDTYLSRQVNLQKLEMDQLAEDADNDVLDKDEFNSNPKNPKDFPSRRFDFGLTVVELDQSDLNKEKAFVITNVTPGSLAWRKELRAGFTIIKVDGRIPESFDQLIQKIEAKVIENSEITLLVEKPDESRAEIKMQLKP